MIVIISIPSPIDGKQTMLYNIVEHIILSDILCVLSTPVIAITYPPAPHTYAGLAKEISLCCFYKKKLCPPGPLLRANMKKDHENQHLCL